MRKNIILALILILAAVSCSHAEEIKIGSCIYRFNDAFMLRFRNAMTAESEKLGAKIEMADGQDDQTTQDGQVDQFIADGVNVLIVNPVDHISYDDSTVRHVTDNIVIGYESGGIWY